MLNHTLAGCAQNADEGRLTTDPRSTRDQNLSSNLPSRVLRNKLVSFVAQVKQEHMAGGTDRRSEGVQIEFRVGCAVFFADWRRVDKTHLAERKPFEADFTSVLYA